VGEVGRMGHQGEAGEGWTLLAGNEIRYMDGLTSISSRRNLPFLPYARKRTCLYAALFPLFAASSFFNSYWNRILSAISTQVNHNQSAPLRSACISP